MSFAFVYFTCLYDEVSQITNPLLSERKKLCPPLFVKAGEFDCFDFVAVIVAFNDVCFLVCLLAHVYLLC